MIIKQHRIFYSKIAKNIDYTYSNKTGQVTGIATPAFSQTLKYDDGANPCYNGNLSEMTVRYGNGTAVTRSFSYDRLNRLTGQTSSDGYNTAYTYNLNSSPLTVMRRGLMSDGTTGTVDDLLLCYKGNQISAVAESAEPVILERSLDYSQGSIETIVTSPKYNYDSSGRLTEDPSQGITKITYHVNDRPGKITVSGNSAIEYEYDYDGNKLSVKHSTVGVQIPLIPGSVGSLGPTRHGYCGSFEFDHAHVGGRLRSITLSRVNCPWGYFDAEGNEYRYVSDWQGNIRAVVDSLGTAVQTTDYYPYGLPMATSTGPEVNTYKYGGKELETCNGLNQYDYHARMYPPTLPLFSRPDDLAGKYPHLNPYLYCAANPIKFVDKTGKYFVDATGAKVTYNAQTQTWSDNATTDIKRYASFMQKTETGKRLFNDIYNNDILTTVEFKDHYIDEKSGNIDYNIYGKTIMDYKTGSKANIVIYEGSILKSVPSFNDTANTPKTRKGRLRQMLLISFDQFCSDVCVHEGVHATDTEDRVAENEVDSENIMRREQRADEAQTQALWEFVIQNCME